MKIQRALALTASLAAATALAGCSSAASTSDDTASTEAADTSASFPLTMTHAFGETEIDSQPERVTTVGWGNQDAAIALGVVPNGVSDQTWSFDGSDDAGLYPWTTDAIDDLDGDTPVVFDDSTGLDFEAVADTTPDVILAAYSGITEEEYTTLSDIAPTVAYPDVAWATDWRDAITLNATALGLETQGEDLVADLEAQIADAVAAHPELEGKTAAFLSVSESDLSSFYVYLPGDPRADFLADLGLSVPESITALGEENAGLFATSLSAENADQLADVDILLTYGEDSVVEALQADPLLSTLPAVENGAVIPLGLGDELSAATSPTALSIPWVIDDYTALLGEAAAKVQ